MLDNGYLASEKNIFDIKVLLNNFSGEIIPGVLYKLMPEEDILRKLKGPIKVTVASF